MAGVNGGWTISLRGNEKNLFIFESPSETKTVIKYINKYYPNSMCVASNGHFLELTNGKDMGIKGFDKFLDGKVNEIKTLEPTFKVEPGHKNVEKNLKKAIDVIKKNGGTIYLSQDPDREGELISYEIKKHFKLKESEYIRVRGTSIEEMDYVETVKKAISNNSKIDKNYVNAALTRTFLDKLYGFVQTKKLWDISSKKGYQYLNELINFLEKKINKFKEDNQSLKNNEQFKKIIEKYDELVNNLKNKKNL